MYNTAYYAVILLVPWHGFNASFTIGMTWHGKAIVVAFTCISHGLPAAFQCSGICSVEFYCLALFVWPFALGRPRWSAVVSM